MAADGSVVIEARMNTSQAEKDLAKLKSKIEKAEDNLDETRQKRDAAEQKSVFDAAELDAEKAKLEKMKQDLQEMKAIAKDKGFSAGVREETKAQIHIAQAELAEQQQRVRALQSEWNKTQSTVERYDRQIADATSKIEKQKAEAGQLENRLDEARTPAGRLASAFDGSGSSLEKLGKRISGLAKRVFIFSIITAALRTMRTWLSKVIKTNDEATAAFSRLKGALLTLAQPLVEIIIPALTTLANILTVIVTSIASLLSGLFGKTAKQSADAAKGLYEETQALEGVGGAAEEAAGSLAGFDEINTIQTENSKGGGGGGAAASMPDFTLDSNITDRLKEIADLVMLIGAGLALWKISSMLPGVLGTIARLLAGILLTVGGLLLFWNGLADAWENGVDWLNLIEMIGGLAAAALGLYLLFGPIAAGVALVVGGLVMLVTAFHDAMENGWSLQNTLLAIAGIFATGLGISLLTGSFIPALIAGIAALLLAFTVATGHGEELIAGIQEIIQGFKDFFTGVFTGDLEKAIKGISEIFDGLGVSIGAVIDGVRDTILSFLDWLDEKTGGKLTGIINVIKALFTTTFDTIKSTVGNVIAALEQIFTGLVQFVGGVFTGDWDTAWEGVKNIFKGAWNGIVSLLEGAVNLIIRGINGLISMLNKVKFSFPDWVPAIGGKSVGFNIPSISTISIPRLAQGAVIPPNREFMAVLGDQTSGNNYEVPDAKLRQLIREETGDSVEVLRQILQAIKEGSVIQVGETVFGRTAIRSINNVNRAAGRQLLNI